MSSRLAGICALVSIAVVTAPAWADPAAAPAVRLGVDLGLAAGYAIPFGSIGEDPPQSVDGFVSSAVPITFDAGYQLNSTLAVGFFLQFALLQLQREHPDLCAGETSCRGWSTAFGPQVTVRAQVPWRWVPWFRLGFGYEWMRINHWDNVIGEPGSATATFRGLVFGIAQVGVEYGASPDLALGPFVALSVGRFDRIHLAGDTGSMPIDEDRALPSRSLHAWLMIGLRGVFHR